ncbi:sensor histidine kinase [Mycolicibacterium litorale]|nr:sensor histidine kinase [Mycolicibacterium litorale]
MWRAAQVFRLLSYAYAVYFQVTRSSELDRPTLSWVLFGALSVWTLVCAAVYLQGFGRRTEWVLAEVAVVVALMLGTEVVASDQWVADNQSLPTTLWATNATISVAVLLGPVAGMAVGAVVVGTAAAMKGQINLDLGRNASIVIELAVGLAVGMAAQTARRAHAELERAARLSAAVEERERLSRQVHDGVVQVLALVAKRGRELGGEAAELAGLAGEQERALRRLISTAGPDERSGVVDMRTLLARRESDRVSVSLPGTVVRLDAAVAAELDAAVGNALDNVAAHAGPQARAFVFLEDLGDTVTITVRDDGPGIAPGRLEQAAAEGRVGISKSIVGRLRSLGGSATLSSDDGGTEWELSVPGG